MRDTLISFMYRFISQSEDPVADRRVFAGRVMAGQEAVIGVESGVEQILPVEFLEDLRLEQKARGLRIAGVRLVDSPETLDGAWIIHVVEVLESLPDQRVAVQRVGVNLGPATANGCEKNNDQPPGARCLQQQAPIRNFLRV
jgi:hypothetical protein